MHIATHHSAPVCPLSHPVFFLIRKQNCYTPLAGYSADISFKDPENLFFPIKLKYCLIISFAVALVIEIKEAVML